MSEYRPLSELLPKFCANLLTGPPPVIYQTGIVPVRRGEVLALTARPGAGKTALIMGMTCDALHHHPDLHAVVANVEMSWEQLLEREISRVSGVKYGWIQSRQFRSVADYVARVEAAQATIAKVAARLMFVGSPFTLQAVDRAIEQHDARWVVLDYLQRFQPFDDDSRNPPDARLRVNECMNLVRGLADQGRAMLVVSAASRTGQGKDKYADLGLGSFRESSELEFGGDSIFTLDRDDDGHCLLKPHKTRYYQGREVMLDWDGDSQRFTRADGGKPHE
jgi:hypothetical protein